jgi:hypothetical protein
LVRRRLRLSEHRRGSRAKKVPYSPRLAPMRIPLAILKLWNSLLRV